MTTPYREKVLTRIFSLLRPLPNAQFDTAVGQLEASRAKNCTAYDTLEVYRKNELKVVDKDHIR